MKKAILYLGVLLAVYMANAQSVKHPIDRNINTSSQQIQKQKLADLSVPFIELVSAVRDENAKAFIVKVKAQIKNNGNEFAPASKLRGFVQKANGGVQLKMINDPISIPAIKAGGVYESEFTFSIPFNLQHENQFRLLVRADNTYVVKESNESNNSSVGILIGL